MYTIVLSIVILIALAIIFICGMRTERSERIDDHVNPNWAYLAAALWFVTMFASLTFDDQRTIDLAVAVTMFGGIVIFVAGYWFPKIRSRILFRV